MFMLELPAESNERWWDIMVFDDLESDYAKAKKAYDKYFDEKIKENMFTYQTTKPDRKWFLTKINAIYDLNNFSAYYLRVIETEEKKEFEVNAYNFNHERYRMGIFDTEQEAKDYIKEIYNFLVGN